VINVGWLEGTVNDQLPPRLLFAGIWITMTVRVFGPALIERDVSPRTKMCVGAILLLVSGIVVVVATHIHWVPARDGYGVP
jgi:hypothetical protein